MIKERSYLMMKKFRQPYYYNEQALHFLWGFDNSIQF
jgi:hypothetical protein